MKPEHTEAAIRAALETWPLDDVRAPEGLAEQVVTQRKRRRRGRAMAAGAALAVAGLSAGVFAFLGPLSGDSTDREGAGPAAGSVPDGWQPWQTKIKVSDGSCAIDGSELYCNGMGADLVRINALTGKTDWTLPEKDASGAGASVLPGVRDGVAYTFRDHATGASAAGTDLVAVDTTTAKELWSRELNSDNRDQNAALLFSRGVLANTPGDRDLAALDPVTGRTLWTHTADKGIWCDRTVVAGTPYLICHAEGKNAPAGSEIIRLDPETGATEKIAELPTTVHHAGNSGDDIVLTEMAEMAGKIGKVTYESFSTVDTRAEKATTTELSGKGGEGTWRPSVAGRVLFLPRPNGEVTAVSVETGKQLWHTDLKLDMGKSEGRGLAETPSDAIISERFNVAYFMSKTGDTVGVSVDSGEERWRGKLDLAAEFGGRPQLMLMEDVLVGRMGSRLASVAPDPF